MKFISKKDMGLLKNKFLKHESNKIVLDSGKYDKDKLINSLSADLTYVFIKLGYYPGEIPKWK